MRDSLEICTKSHYEKGDTAENLIGLLKEDLMQLFIDLNSQILFFHPDN